jgi:hypothetical protein
MNKLLWTIQILLTLALGLFGLQKVVLPIPDLIEFGMLWIEDFPAWQVRTIGLLEVLGVLGLNAPYLIKRIPRLLTSAAAVGLALTMVGAVITHLLRGDPAASVIITSALGGMSLFLAVQRFGQLRSPRI